jgi:hypothetical protein
LITGGGWRVVTPHAGFVMDALEQAIDERHPACSDGLIHQDAVRLGEATRDLPLQGSNGSMTIENGDFKPVFLLDYPTETGVGSILTRCPGF